MLLKVRPFKAARQHKHRRGSHKHDAYLLAEENYVLIELLAGFSRTLLGCYVVVIKPVPTHSLFHRAAKLRTLFID
jgi:hypothetical protein